MSTHRTGLMVPGSTHTSWRRECDPAAEIPVPAASSGQPGTGAYIHPDKLDAALFRIAGVCVLALVMVNLDITVISVAQRTFISAFHSTQAIVAWTTSGYSLALATVIPLAGWAADRFGTKRLFMGSVLAFAFGSLLCANAPNIASLIAFRMVQGLGGGMLMPLAFTIMTHAAGPQRLGRLMAVLGIPTLLGPIGGPVLGGWLIDTHSWQWIFWINVPIGLTAFVLADIVFRQITRRRRKPSTSSAWRCCRLAWRRFCMGCRASRTSAPLPTARSGLRWRSVWH